MKARNFKKLVQKLKEKFELKDDSTDHISFEIWMSGVLITRIKTSHSPKDYQDRLIAKNLHVSLTDLNRYVDCIVSNEDLIKKIKEKGYWSKSR